MSIIGKIADACSIYDANEGMRLEYAIEECEESVKHWRDKLYDAFIAGKHIEAEGYRKEIHAEQARLGRLKARAIKAGSRSDTDSAKSDVVFGGKPPPPRPKSDALPDSVDAMSTVAAACDSYERTDDPIPTTPAIETFIEKTNAEVGMHPNIK